MATVKLQNGNVILKDGKVSCSCCEPECCMYAAQALAQSLYSSSDLPDAVTVDGTSFNRSGTSYGNTTNGVIFEENVWAKYRNGARSTRSCLIQSGVEDQFADTYTVTIPAFFENQSGTYTATRRNLCQWSVAGFEGQLEYFPDSFSWEININNEFGPINEIKDDPQNSPIGSYGPSPRTCTVS